MTSETYKKKNLLSIMISISILDCDLLNLERTLIQLKSNNIAHLHLDILDTSFVPNISFGPGIINKILQYDFVFDCHMMVQNPITILKLLDLNKVDTVFVHFEIEDLSSTINFLINKNVKIGIAICPETRIEDVNEEVLENIDKFLIMTVHPGFGNQKFLKSCIEKIKKIDRKKYKIGVDGGIDKKTIEMVKDFDFVVIGSAYFKEKDKKKFINDILRI